MLACLVDEYQIGTSFRQQNRFFLNDGKGGFSEQLTLVVVLNMRTWRGAVRVTRAMFSSLAVRTRVSERLILFNRASSISTCLSSSMDI